MTITGKRCPLKASAALANTHGNSRVDAPWTALAVPTLTALLLACTAKPAPVRPAAVQDIRIVEMPPRPSCYVSAMPEPPELLEIEYDADEDGGQDILKRAFVHWKSGNQIIQWERDFAVWAEEVRVCLMLITGQEGP